MRQAARTARLVSSAAPRQSLYTGHSRFFGTSTPTARTPAPAPAPAPPPPPALDPLPRGLKPTIALLLLSVPAPPHTWPSHLEPFSPLLASTAAVLRARGVAVNVVYEPGAVDRGGVLGIGPGPGGEGEAVKATMYWGDGRVLVWEEFGEWTIGSEEMDRALAYVPSPSPLSSPKSPPKEIWVCTHGSRDCRCFDKGVPLLDALQSELVKRGLEGIVRVGQVAHVGGHKYAANAILVPTLDMLSHLTASDAPRLISHLLAISSSPAVPTASLGETMWERWRGRYGHTAEQQAAIWDIVSGSESASASAPTSVQTHETVKLTFKTYTGDEIIVDAKIGDTLLAVGKANQLPSLEGTCGGNLECATCHLYLSQNPAPSVQDPSDAEWDMLGYAVGYRDDESRLGCQVVVTRELGQWAGRGGVIGLPRF